MEKLLEAWAGGVQTAAGKALAGIVLYGSATRGDYVAGRSDLNLMLIFKRVDLALLADVGEFTRRQLAKHSPQLICWTRDELKNAWDVFPLEFEDIAKNHRCLWGEDPFKRSRVEKKNARYQLEFELRSKLLALRAAWLRLHDDRAGLEQFLAKSGSSLHYLLEKAETIFKIKGTSADQVFGQISRIKKGQLRLKPDELQALYGALHAAVESVVGQIDCA